MTTSTKTWTSTASVAVLGLTLATLRLSCTQTVETTTPEEFRYGLAADHESLAAEHIKGMTPFALRDDDGNAIVQDNAADNVRLWWPVLKLRGAHLPNEPQQVGDCVSWGLTHALMYLQFQLIDAGQAVEYHAPFPPYIYGTSRVQIGGARLRADGSVGAWAAKAVQQYGVLPADEDNVPPYSGQIARQWGERPGVPQRYLDIGRQQIVRAVAPVRSADDVRDAICNGYPCTIASNVGFAMRPPTIDGRLVNSRQGRWGHQMCVIGYDGRTGSEPYWYILNSWGPNAHGKPPDDSPPGGFWVRRGDIEAIVSQGDSFAFSGFDGFRARDLDVSIFGAKGQMRQP